MDPVNFLYWLKGYLDVDDHTDFTSIIDKLDLTIKQYEENKDVIANSAATLTPYLYEGTVLFPNTNTAAPCPNPNHWEQPAKPFAEIVN